MSNFNRKIRRRKANQLGLPTGFFCKKMQNKLARLHRQVEEINQNIDAQTVTDESSEGDNTAFVGGHSAGESLDVKDGNES